VRPTTAPILTTKLNDFYHMIELPTTPIISPDTVAPLKSNDFGILFFTRLPVSMRFLVLRKFKTSEELLFDRKDFFPHHHPIHRRLPYVRLSHDLGATSVTSAPVQTLKPRHAQEGVQGLRNASQVFQRQMGEFHRT
jgi:hypothetical protein